MAETYKVKAVKSVPKEWDSKYGAMKTWLIQVEGDGEPLQLNKKADSPMPQVGEELYGSIQETEFGRKFKGEKKPFTQNGFKGQPRDDSAIQAQWAINQSREYIQFQLGKDANLKEIMETAKIFYGMIDQVKGNASPKTDGAEVKVQPQSGYEKAKQVREKLPQPMDVPNFDFDPEEPVNLDDIPF